MVFRPDKMEVARSFKRCLTTYDENALIQKKVSERLVRLLRESAGREFKRALEVGCCTGMLSEMFCSQFSVGTLYVNDLVPELCEKAKERVLRDLQTVEIFPGDIEELDIPGRLDLILSSSTMQWLSDFPGMLQRFSKALVNGGYLAISLFGDGTFREIKELTGRGLHYLPFEQICSTVGNHFDILRTEISEDRLFFPNPRDVLRHLQATGVSGLGYYRWTSATLRSFESEYRRLYGSEEEVGLSYVSHYLVARKKIQEDDDGR